MADIMIDRLDAFTLVDMDTIDPATVLTWSSKLSVGVKNPLDPASST